MKKRICSLLLCIVMVIAMIPLTGITADAVRDPIFTREAEYYYQNDGDPTWATLSLFTKGDGGWYGGLSPKTKDLIAHFDVLKVEIKVPAYTDMAIEFYLNTGVTTMTSSCSSYFGVEVFQFDDYGSWNTMNINLDENTTKSNEYSRGRSTAHKVAIVAGSKDAEANIVHRMEFDNSNGEEKTISRYFGILAFYRQSTVFEHQLQLNWDITDVFDYPIYKYLHYDANGGSGSADTVKAKETQDVTLHSGEGFSKSNSVYLGWSDGSNTYAPGSEYTELAGARMYAQYLTYDISNCSGTVTPGTRGEDGIAIADGSGLYKVGHTFQYWTDDPNGNGTKYEVGDLYSSRQGLTLYPFFEPNKYDLTLVTDHCAIDVNQNPATYGTKVDVTSSPSVGYTVKGYEAYKTDDSTVKVAFTDADSFIQPEYPVTVKPVLEKILYAVEKLPTESGTFTVSHEAAGVDDVVTVTATPDAGFELDTIAVSRIDNGEFLTVTDGRFTMVPAPVRVSVSFKNCSYNITKAPTNNGSFTLNPENAISGDTVVVNAVPDEGYRVKSITAYKTGEETATIEVKGGSFVMPAFPVTVAVEFEPTSLEVFKSSNIENGDITISHTQARLGETITVAVQPAMGYTLDAITVYKNGNETVTVEVTDGSFVMPPYSVTVHATFQKSDYTISVVDDSNEKGSFTVDKTTAQMGDIVTVDIICAEGWAVRSITLTQSNGESTMVDKVFAMPADDVTVSVVYMVVPTYLITIPTAVELGGAPMTVKITDAVMEAGVNLKITLETDFTARTAEGAEKTFVINGGSVQSGDVILTVEGGGTPLDPKSGSVQLSLGWDENYQYSGQYRATLAFTIRVEDEGYDQSEGGTV